MNISNLSLSRQRRWQLKKATEGKCQLCGLLKENKELSMCNSCGEKNRDRRRKTQNFKGGITKPSRYIYNG